MIPPLSDTMNFFVSASVARRMDSEVMLGTNTLPTSSARPAAKHEYGQAGCLWVARQQPYS